MRCPCCGAQLEFEKDGAAHCAVTGLGYSTSLSQRLKAHFQTDREWEALVDDFYFAAKWRCPGCGSPLTNDDSVCPLCHKSVVLFAPEIAKENPVHCDRPEHAAR